MHCAIFRNLGLHCDRNYVLVRGLPKPAGSLSLLDGASPAVVEGCWQAIDYKSSPDSYGLTLTEQGVPAVFSGGDTTGQDFQFDVYDIRTRDWYGDTTVYINDDPPLLLDAQPQVVFLPLNYPVNLDLRTESADPESLPLIVDSVDSMPSGLVLTAPGLLTGSPDTAGSYDIHFTVTDPAGNVVNYPLYTFVVGEQPAAYVDQTITITKVRAGAQGPSGGGTDGITVNLTKESYSVLCYAEGTPIDPTFAGVDGYATVFKGAADDTITATLSSTGSGCTGTVNTDTDTPVIGQPKGYYRITGLTLDNATLNITAVDSGATITRQFVVTKARAGYEIVSVLPTTNLFNGRMVYLTTDGKLYRYKTGTGWTAATAAADITGQITTTQISDHAISTPKLAAGSVDTTILTASAVLANNISAGAITAAKLAASNVVTATAQIGDLIVSTIKIQGDAVTQAAQVSTEGLWLLDVDGGTQSTWLDLDSCSLSFTSTGERVTVLTRVECPQDPAGIAAVGDYVEFRLIRDATAIGNAVRFRAGNWPSSYSGFCQFWNGVFTDTPPGGTHTYKIQYFLHSTHALASKMFLYGRGIQIREDKR